MRSLLSGVLISAGVDWITVTARSADNIEKCREIALSLIESELSQGMFGKPWFQSGYEGVSCGHVQYGERADGCIVRLGATVASAHWQRLFQVCDNVSRLDLQATYRLDGSVYDALERHYREVQRERKRLKRAPKLRKVVDDDGGYTMYCGSRKSDVFGRAYDKGVESGLKEFENCVRYETQYGGARALRVARSLLESSANITDIARSCLMFFEHRGAVLKTLAEKLNSRVILMTSTARVIKADTERVLRWFGSAVRPSVKRLLVRGFRDRLLFSLGIFELGESLNYQYDSR